MLHFYNIILIRTASIIIDIEMKTINLLMCIMSTCKSFTRVVNISFAQVISLKQDNTKQLNTVFKTAAPIIISPGETCNSQLSISFSNGTKLQLNPANSNLAISNSRLFRTQTHFPWICPCFFFSHLLSAILNLVI